MKKGENSQEIFWGRQPVLARVEVAEQATAPHHVALHVLFAITLFFLLFRPGITGLVGQEEVSSFSQSIDLLVRNSSEMVLDLRGVPLSFFVSGSVNGSGSAKIFLVSGIHKYVVYDSATNFVLITGASVVETNETTSNNSETTTLENSSVLNNTTIPSNESGFNASVEEVEETNSTVPESQTLSRNNSEESEILPIEQTIVTMFNNACQETCTLLGDNATVRLEFEVENAVLSLDSISYEVSVSEPENLLVVNAPPQYSGPISLDLVQGQQFVLNLTPHISDPDNDSLILTATSVVDFLTSVTDDILVITPDENITGRRVMTLILTDGMHIVRQEVVLDITPFVSVTNVTTTNTTAIDNTTLPVNETTNSTEIITPLNTTKLSQDIDSRVLSLLDVNNRVSVIVVLRENVSEGRRNRESLKEKEERIELLSDDFLRKTGRHEKDDVPSAGNSITGNVVFDVSSDVAVALNMSPVVFMNITAEDLVLLQQLPEVVGVYYDADFQLSMLESVSLIGADRVVSELGVSGVGSGVCLLDTGVDFNHSLLVGRVVGGHDFVNGDDDASDDSANSHGTHLAGILVSVASGVGIVPVKVCDAFGVCKASSILAGIDYCTSQAASLGVAALSGSFGDGVVHAGSDCPHLFDLVLETARGQGVVPVFASGNDGSVVGSQYPACDPEVVSVGASSKNDMLWSNTNKGKLDLLAPGVDVSSSIIGGGFGVRSGTSVAVPFVAGTLALLREAQQAPLNTQLVKSLLQNTGKDVTGFKRIDAFAAVSSILSGTNATQNVTFLNTTFARLEFKEPTDLSGFDECSILDLNFINVDSGQCPQFNRPARLWFYGLPYVSNLTVFKDGVLCSDCENLTYNQTNIFVDVQGFSTYTIGGLEIVFGTSSITSTTQSCFPISGVVGRPVTCNITVTADAAPITAVANVTLNNGTTFINVTQNANTSTVFSFTFTPALNDSGLHNVSWFVNDTTGSLRVNDQFVSHPGSRRLVLNVQTYNLTLTVSSTSIELEGGQSSLNSVPFVTLLPETTDNHQRMLVDVFFNGNNNKNLTIRRSAVSTGLLNIIATVVEFNAEHVRVVNTSICATTVANTPCNTTIPGGVVVDNNRTAMIFYYNTSDITDDYEDNLVQGHIHNTTKLNFTRDSITGGTSGTAYLFESIDDSFEVQQISPRVTGTTKSTNTTIDAVQMNKTMLISSWLTTEVAGAPQSASVSVQLSSATNVHVKRGANATPATDTVATNIFVINFSRDEFVQRGNLTFVGYSNTTANDVLTTVNLSLALAYSSTPLGRMEHEGLDGFAQASLMKINLTNGSVVRGHRGFEGGQAEGMFEVIEFIRFPLAVIDPLCTLTNNLPILSDNSTTCSIILDDDPSPVTVKANVTNPFGTVITMTVSNISNNHSFTFSKPNFTGIFNVSWFVNDSEGRIAVLNSNFTVNAIAFSHVQSFNVSNNTAVSRANATFNGSDDNANPQLESLGSGDFNNDGFVDVIVGSILTNAGGIDGGQAQVFFGPFTNGSSFNFGNRSQYANVTINGTREKDNLGFGVAGGDVNNDSVDDILVTTNANLMQAGDEGGVFVFFGPFEHGKSINAGDTAANRNYNVSFNNTQGDNVSDVETGDFNNDGVDDVLLGVGEADKGAANGGQAFIFFGPFSHGFSAVFEDVAGGGYNVSFNNTLVGAARLGTSVGAGDVNNDGVADVLLTSFTSTNQEVLAFFGPFFQGQSINGSSLTTNFENASVSGFDVGINADGGVTAKDLNRDGVDDIIIGDYESDPSGITGAGMVFVLFGPVGEGTVRGSIDDVTHFTNITVNGSGPNDNVGVAVAAADFNADGTIDLLVGGQRVGVEDTVGQNANGGQGYLLFNPGVSLGITERGCRPQSLFSGQSSVCNATVEQDSPYAVLVRANVTYPNGTSYNITVITGALTYSVNFSGANLTGSYVINWLVNNSNGSLQRAKDVFNVNNSVPTIASVSIASALGTDTTDENLTATPVSVADVDSNNTVSVNFNWLVNGTSWSVLNLPMTEPFDNGTDNVTFDMSSFKQGQLGPVTARPFFNASGGVYGGAYKFDGDDDFIRFNDSNDLDLKNFTLSVWFNLPGEPYEISGGNGKNMTFLDHQNFTPRWGYFLRFQDPNVTSDSVMFRILNGTAAVDLEFRDNTTAIRNNTWHYLVATYNESVMSLFIDANRVASRTGGGVLAESDRPLVIGASSFSTSNFFNGSIDEVVIYNRTLSLAQIRAIFNESKPRYDVIVPDETGAVGENWTAVAVPVDSVGLNGSRTFSPNLTIVEASANFIPLAPNLTAPANSTTITNKTPVFSWNNSFDSDAADENLSYNLVVDDDVAFGSPALNVSGIVETEVNRTNFTSTVELTVDTQYFWRVRANDTESFSPFSVTFNFTLESLLSIDLSHFFVNFQTLFRNSSANTTNGTVDPFVVENIGNVVANVTVTGTKLFQNATFPGDAYQFRVDVNETGSFNLTNSTGSFINVTNSSTRFDVSGLDWHDGNDSARIDILINLPFDEPGGARNSTVTVTAVAT